jgi:hypothetical protein
MYKAALFAPDGDWITDYRASTIKDVWLIHENSGSRWFFYPIIVIITDHGTVTTATQRIVDAPDLLADFKGKSLRTLSKFIKENQDWVTQVLSL